MAQMTIKEIVDETVEYYRQDPRSRRSFLDAHYEETDGAGVCSYEGCAIGRCFDRNHPEVERLLEFEATTKNTVGSADAGLLSFLFGDDIKDGNAIDFDSLLLPQYRGHSLDFWAALQRLHDEEDNWIENDISIQGEMEAARIIRAYTNMEEEGKV